jgi:1-deoxy-D-xylulose-5-phosphate reductoisomerase
MTKQILLLGSTGTIGQNTIEVVKANPHLYRIKALVAGTNAQALAIQALELQPDAVAISDESKYQELKQLLSGTKIEVVAGKAALLALAAQSYDITVSGIVGIAALEPTIASLEGSKIVALANKESLVCAGELMVAKARANNVKIIPLDSEHSAIYQTLENSNIDKISKVTLTASGGPFRKFSLEKMKSVTPAQAVKHPNWGMGAKISVDCATLMNKGLEVIETHKLFPVSVDQIDVVVHPESIVHCLVSYKDGAVLAQLAVPDMRTPIAYALGYPKRLAIDYRPLDLVKLGSLNFEDPDITRFPLLDLAYQALQSGSQAALIKLNTSNEIAVQRFLEGKINFLDIADTVKQAMDKIPERKLSTLEEVLSFSDSVANFI